MQVCGAKISLGSRRNRGYTTWICQVTWCHEGFETAGRTAVSSQIRHHKHIECLFKHQFMTLASRWCQDFTRMEEKPKVRYTTYICPVTHPHVGFKTARWKAVSSWFRYCKHIDCLFEPQITALASMWCQDFTRIEDKWVLHDLNMSSDSMSRGVWNGRANGSFKSNSWSQTHRMPF